MKKLLILFGLLLAAVSQAAYGYHRVITFGSTTEIPSAQTNFTWVFKGTLAYLATVANGGNVTNSSGYDIVFSPNIDGSSPYSFELVSYDPATGAIEAWIKKPTLTAGDTCNLVYGNAGVSTFQGGSGAWDASWGLVMHLQNGASPTDSLGVSTPVNHSATATAGQVGGGAAVVGSGPSYIDTGYAPNPGSGDFTMTCWTNDNEFVGAPLGIDDSFNFVSLFSKWQWTIPIYGQQDTGVSTDGSFHRLTLRSTSGLCEFFLDGVLKNSQAQFSPSIGSTNLLISIPGYNPATCTVDEVRWSTVARSADWETCSWRNQKSSSTFFALGSEVVNASPSNHKGLPTLGVGLCKAVNHYAYGI